MNSPLQEITIGLPRDNLNHFDDFNSLKFHPSPYKIKKITVQFNNEEIWGLKILYVDGNGKEVKGQSSLKFKPLRTLFTSLTKESFTVADGISQNDFIKQIHGFASNEIHQIGFETYRGHKKVFGIAKGKHFSFCFPEHTFTIASGSYDRYLHFLRFKVDKLSEDFIQKYCPQVKTQLDQVNVNVIIQPPEYNYPTDQTQNQLSSINNYSSLNMNYPPPPIQENFNQGQYSSSPVNQPPPPQYNYPSYPSQQNYPPPIQNYPQQQIIYQQMPPPPPPPPQKQVIVVQNQNRSNNGMGIGTAMALGTIGGYGTARVIQSMHHHHHGHHGHHSHHHHGHH